MGESLQAYVGIGYLCLVGLSLQSVGLLALSKITQFYSNVGLPV